MTSPGSDEIAVTLYFHGRPLAEWSRDDRKVILHKLQDLMRVKREGKRKPRRARHAKNGR
jgi:hypothetical protein